MIRADKNYSGGPVRLIACSAGKHENGAAQQLSNILGVEVLAPTDTLYVNGVGEMAIAASMFDASAVFVGIKDGLPWKSFFPDERMGGD